MPPSTSHISERMESAQSPRRRSYERKTEAPRAAAFLRKVAAQGKRVQILPRTIRLKLSRRMPRRMQQQYRLNTRRQSVA